MTATLERSSLPLQSAHSLHAVIALVVAVAGARHADTSFVLTVNPGGNVTLVQQLAVYECEVGTAVSLGAAECTVHWVASSNGSSYLHFQVPDWEALCPGATRGSGTCGYHALQTQHNHRGLEMPPLAVWLACSVLTLLPRQPVPCFAHPSAPTRTLQHNHCANNHLRHWYPQCCRQMAS